MTEIYEWNGYMWLLYFQCQQHIQSLECNLLVDSDDTWYTLYQCSGLFLTGVTQSTFCVNVSCAYVSFFCFTAIAHYNSIACRSLAGWACWFGKMLSLCNLILWYWFTLLASAQNGRVTYLMSRSKLVIWELAATGHLANLASQNLIVSEIMLASHWVCTF